MLYGDAVFVEKDKNQILMALNNSKKSYVVVPYALTGLLRNNDVPGAEDVLSKEETGFTGLMEIDTSKYDEFFGIELVIKTYETTNIWFVGEGVIKVDDCWYIKNHSLHLILTCYRKALGNDTFYGKLGLFEVI
jgi:hypothetical protein